MKALVSQLPKICGGTYPQDMSRCIEKQLITALKWYRF